MRFAIALMTFAALATAQEAKVMILERSDTTKLAKAYKDYKDALKHWDEIKTEVAKSYTIEGGGKDAKTIPGWEKVQFSPDFRAIVPEDSRYASTGRSCYFTGWTTGTVSTPAIGTTSQTPLLYNSNTGTFSASAEGYDESRQLGIAGDLIVKEK